MRAIEILVNDSHGQYMPKVFVETFDLSLWSNINPLDIETIKSGPENEWYWVAWDSILQDAYYNLGGFIFHLCQNGDLFACCDAMMTDEEYAQFYGESRE